MANLNFKPVSSPSNTFNILASIILIYVAYKVLKFFGLFSKDGKEQTLNESIENKQWADINFWKKNPPSGYTKVLFPMSITDEICNDLYDSFSSTGTSIFTFGIVQDNEEKMIATLKKLSFQTQYSWVAYRFAQLYNLDLTATLKKYFSDEELFPAWYHIDNLPTYLKNV
jgi:hypothetical protein